MDELNKKLSAGWTPFLEQQAPKSFHSLFDVLDTYLRMMKKEAEPHSYRSYKSYIKYLITWLYRNGYDKTFMVAQFNSNMASDIMLEIRESDRYSYRTYNNYLQFFVTLFNWMMQWNYLG
ncbi:MAG: hypothetical protein PHD07_07595, partial [Bacteroidales bacterium]|nr:hypothetical protein [Bacteroidales bacterium]